MTSAFDFGVEYTYDGKAPAVTSWGWTEDAARAFVADHGSRGWVPRPCRVWRRPVGDPEPADTP